MVYIEIQGVRYPAEVFGRSVDKDWDNRESLSIITTMSQSEAMSLFADDIEWNLITEDIEELPDVNEETGEQFVNIIVNTQTYDKSDYSVLGDIIAHRNGTVTIKMGKPTAEELLEMLIGGIGE